MFSAYVQLIRLLGRLKTWIRIKRLAEGLLLTFIILSGLIFFFCFLDHIFPFTNQSRFYILISIIASALFFFLWLVIVPSLARLNEKELALMIQRKYPVLKDDLINSLQLFYLATSHQEIYVSRALIAELVKNTARKIRTVNIFEVESVKSIRKYICLAGVALFTFSITALFFPDVVRVGTKRIFFPFAYGNAGEVISVQPGNTKVVYGTSTRIIVETSPKPGIPELVYRIAGDSWQKVKMEREATGTGHPTKYSYEFRRITQPISYYIKWRELRTQVFSLELVVLPQVGDLVIKYKYPAYTGLQEQIEETSGGNICALLGTQAKISLKANKPISKGFLLTDNGKKFPLEVERGLTLKGSFVLTGEKTYWIEVEDTEGYTNVDPPIYNINTLLDNPPAIRIINPGCDLTVPQRSELDLVYEFNDDYGVSKIELVYQKLKGEFSVSGKEENLLVEQFSKPQKGNVLVYRWSLGNLKLTPGTVLSYYLQAWDNDAVSGPKKARSQTYYLEIFSPLKEHERIADEERQLKEEIMRILGNEILTRNRLEKWEDSQDINELRAIELEQKQIGDSIEKLIESIGSLIPKIEKDSLSSSRVLSEYSAMKEDLTYIQETMMKELLANFSQALSQADPAGRKSSIENVKYYQDGIISELERLSLLSQDLFQEERMREILEVSRNLLNNQTELIEALGSWQQLDQATLQELEKTLDDISQLIERLTRTFSQLPDSLPEEFVNQDAIKSLNLGVLSSMVDLLRQKIKAGDLQQALKVAKQFQSQLSSVLAALETAASNVPTLTVYSEMSKNAETYALELDALIQEEKQVIERTGALEKKRLENLVREQESLLRQSAQRQNTIIAKGTELEKLLTENLNYPDLRESLRTALNKMREFLNELTTPTPRRIKELMEESLEKLGSTLRLIQKTLANIHEEKKKISEEISRAQQEDGDQEHIKEKIKALSMQKETQERIETYLSDLRASISGLWNEEKEIADSLNIDEKQVSLFAESDVKELIELAEKQNEIEARTRRLTEKLEMLCGKTALLGKKSVSYLEEAASCMNDAEEKLKEKDSNTALEEEREALYYLGQGKEELASATRKLQELASRGSEPSIGSFQPRVWLVPGGKTGFMEGYVKIPEATSSPPAKLLREELLKALRERYPKAYEGLIKQYYRRLTE